MRISKSIKFRAGGFSLLEVLIAVVVLSVGLLSLAALQSSLVRSSAEAKNRGAAMAFAEQVIENARTLRSSYIDGASGTLGSWAVGACADFGESFDAADMGENYGCSVDVRVFGFCPMTVDGITTRDLRQLVDNDLCAAGDLDPPKDRFAQATVNVSWTDPSGERRYAALSDAIGTLVPDDVVKIFQRPAASRRSPEVRIVQPNEVGIIPIALGNDRTAASSNPKPELSSQGRSTLTQFNVQTYVADSANVNPLLQQRVDFSFINCDCSFNGSSTSLADQTYSPTYWDGDRYKAPKIVIGKPMGSRVTAFQNQERFERGLCDSCCRDHHDDSAAEVRYDAHRPGGDYASGNHNHYRYDRVGGVPDQLVVATSGEYTEVCRFVRVDGFNRVAVDTRLENVTMLNMTGPSSAPELDADDVLLYSEFVKDFVTRIWTQFPASSYPDSSPGSYPIAQDPLVVARVDLKALYDDILDLDEAVIIGPIADADEVNLHSRGIYVDYISSGAVDKLNCIGDTTPECMPYRYKSALEIVPFYAVNLTILSGWNSANFPQPEPPPASPLDTIISVRYDGIQNGEYIRGLVTAKGESGQADARSFAQRGNSGLTDTRATDPDDQTVRSDSERFDASSVVRPKFEIQYVPAPNNLANFEEAKVNARVSVPAMASSFCTLRAGNNPSRRYRICSFTSGATEVVVEVSNYNNAVNEPECTGNGPSQVCTPNIVLYDFKVCGIAFPNPANSYSVSNVQVVSGEATVDEISSVRIQLAGGGALDPAISDPMRTFNVVFAAQGGTCPNGVK